MARPTVAEISEAFRISCRGTGFDLIQPTTIGPYNAAVDDGLRLPQLSNPNDLVVVVANTAALWQPFLKALEADEALREDSDPLNAYTEQIIGSAATTVATRFELKSEIRWAHTLGPGLVAIQRLVDLSGLAALSPSHLNIHPQHGPWIGLRAAVVFNIAGPDASTIEATTAKPQSPCLDCEQPCMPAMEKALAKAKTLTFDEIANQWQLWLAVRDACPVGKDSRYSDEQIQYHYLKSLDLLHALLPNGAHS